MDSYLIRVEMHDKHFDYNLLHREMKRHGCLKQIKADDGTWYDLPEAEYCVTNVTERSPEIVRDFLIRKLDAYGWSFWIMVTRYDCTAWSLRVANRSNALLGDILAM